MLYTFKATSGTPGFQNSKYQNKKEDKEGNAGPTPEATYKIDLTKDPNREAKETKVGDDLLLAPGKGIQQIPKDDNGESNYPAWGDQRARLEKVPGSGNTYGRDNFYLHDSTKGYTHGCVEVETQIFNNLIEYGASGNDNILLKVEYPTNNTNTNGGTKLP